MRVLAALVLACGISANLSAQEVPVIENKPDHAPEAKPLALESRTPEERKELLKWMKDIDDYFDWADKYLNKRAPGLIKGPGKRKAKPDPPEWLAADCAEFDRQQLIVDLARNKQNKEEMGAEDTFKALSTMAQACALLQEYNDDLGTWLIRRERILARREKLSFIHFAVTPHLDAAYVLNQIGSGGYSGIYGPIGMHLTFVNLWDRIQLYIPPGFLWLMLPNSNGGTDSTLSFTFGVSIRLVNFHMPGVQREVSLYVNIIKAAVLSGNYQSGLDMSGVSFTWKK